MIVSDLIYNDDIEIDCDIEIYDCTTQTRKDGAKKVYSTKSMPHKPFDNVLDMKVTLITINAVTKTLIVEATK